MKKKVGIVIFVVIILIIMAVFIGKRIYYFTVIRNVYEAIENFRNEDNRYYAVTMTENNVTICGNIVLKNNILKWNEKRDNVNVYCQWKDFNKNQEYAIIFKDKTFTINEFLITHSTILTNLPKVLLSVFTDNQFNIKEFQKIERVLSVDYNNQKCYKIITDKETLIVDQETYLPIYYSVETVTSEENINLLTETTYEFKVGEVTDEDIALPDLTGFTQINEE